MAVGDEEKKPLDPEWKKKLTACMREIGLMDVPFGQMTIHWGDSKVASAVKQINYK